MEKLDRHGDLLVFVRVAELGSFRRAAEALGISTSHASRALSRLEERVGTRLLNRTTRRVALTEAGEVLFERASVLLSALDEAESSLRDQGGEPHGTLRLSLPVQFGLRYIAPLAAEFTCLHPGVSAELLFEDRRVDLLAEGFDLAIRIGQLSDSSLVARRLGRTRGLTVASARYLEAHGTPTHPRELVQHQGLLYAYDSAGPGWRFLGPEGEVRVRVSGRFSSNNGEALLSAACAGLGIARLPDFVAAESLRQGRLVRILEEWESELPVSAVYIAGRHLAPKVRLFIDLLVERLKSEPWLQVCPPPES